MGRPELLVDSDRDTRGPLAGRGAERPTDSRPERPGLSPREAILSGDQDGAIPGAAVKGTAPRADSRSDQPQAQATGGGRMKKLVVWGIGAAGLAAIALAVLIRGPWWPERSPRGMLRLPGVVEIQEVRLGSKIGGRVAEINVVEGALLSPGQPVVRLEAPELEAQRNQWRARLAAAEAALERAKQGPRTQEIEAVRAAFESAQARSQRLKAGWRAEEVRQAASDLEAAEADLILARQEYERAVRLYQREAIAKADLDLAHATLDRAHGRAASARAHCDMLQSGSRVEDIAEAAAQVDQARANLDLLRAGTRPEDIAAAEATVAEMRGKLSEIEANLREAVVRAPERSIVEVLAVRKGDLLAPNAPVARVLRTDDLWVKAYVPETDLGRVRLNQRALVTIDAYPGRRFEGRVIQIAGIGEFTPRNVQSADERRFQVFGVKVRVADPQGIFKSGLAAEVELPLEGSR